MEYFTVVRVTGSNTLLVSGWHWGDASGNTVKIRGFNPPQPGEQGYEIVKMRLAKLIQFKSVQLGNVSRTYNGTIVCNVYFLNKNINSYFPEYT